MSDLKYLFKALFNDGTSIIQNLDDKPQIAKEGSAFTDVNLRLNDVIKFTLLDLNSQEVVSVNLEKGYFQFAGGPPFLAIDPSIQIPPDTKFKLIYFRRYRHTITPIGVTGQIPTEYHIGYQFNKDDIAYKQTIAII